MTATLSPNAFVAKWRHTSIKERSAAQEHFIDLCRLIGHPTPAEADPAGTQFTFEAGAAKQAGRQGWADVWKRGYFAWEYKGKHADLDRAYQQLLQYRESLQNPPLLVVCDIDAIRIHTNFTNTVKRIYTLALDDLLKPEGLGTLRAVFYEPETLRAPQSTERVTEEAAAEFARLAQLLSKYGADPHQAAHFLIRILFCLFAEDVGLLPKDLFRRLVERSRQRLAAFRQQLGTLFEAMSTGGFFGEHDIPHFDGGLFEDAAVLDLDSDALDILMRVAGLNWSSIKPSIFGTLFERSLDPSKRSQLGAHYTGENDILLIVEPVLMAPLRRHWAEVQAQAHELAARRDAAKGGPRTRLQNELFALLRGFRQEIAATRTLDAACGSGNFLYIALRLLLDLEKEVINLAQALGDSLAFPTVSPEQLYGIEINAYAHELAQVTVWIGYIQWLRENGFGSPSEPILKPLHNIRQMDAILAYDAEGRPVEPDWPEAEVIVGNPPFLGDKKMRGELGDRYVDELRTLYNGRVPGGADLVTYWFERARGLIEVGKTTRAGLLATQGIRGGANRKVLERIRETGCIFWARADRAWVLDGATVHVSMVGFSGSFEPKIELDGKQVAEINADLSAQADLTKAEPLSENSGLSFVGTQKSGPFDLTEQQAMVMLAATGNPNLRPNSDVVKPWINALDITQRPRRMWIIDFGVDMQMEDAAQYERPFEYVLTNVKPVRDLVRREAHRRRWWLFGEIRRGLRDAVAPLSRYIVTPMVSKHRVFAWVSTSIVPENLLVVIARDDDYFFGVLHSHAHEVWSRQKGTQLREAESGQRYTPTTTFETYPFPWPPGGEPTGDLRVEAIAAAARELVTKRDAWLNPPGASEAELKKRTLTNLYNQRPTWLDLAHRRLDRAVLDAYGWPHDIGDEELLSRLLALNLERAT